jgi:hypothetical protein
VQLALQLIPETSNFGDYMAENNNTLMTIGIVLAAAFLFTGGLTGNAGLGKVCNTEKTYGEYLPGGQAAIIGYNSDCTTYIKEYCKETARPFQRRALGVSGSAAQNFELVCADRIIDSTSRKTVIYG